MTAENFCYWLQGLFELSQPVNLDEGQTRLVKQHLEMVFLHAIDPSLGTPEHRAELQKIHDGLMEVKKQVEGHVKTPHRRGDERLMC